MKKNLFTVLAMALASFAFGQVIDSSYLEEYVVMKNGKKTMLDITSDDADFIYFTKDGKENKIPKSQVTDWKAGQLWQQPFKYNEKGEIEYQEVVKLDSLTKDEIYNRAKRMFTKLFKDSRNVLELDDKEAGTLIGNGNTDVHYSTGLGAGHATFWFTITIDVKEGRYRLTLNGFDNEFAATTYTARDRSSLEVIFPANQEPNKYSKKLKEADLQEIDNLFKAIKKMMAEKPLKDW